MIADEDFNDDRVDAGEIGAGTDILALFEIELEGDGDGELFTVNIRYKDHGGTESKLASMTVTAKDLDVRNTRDFGFAGAVALYAEILRHTDDYDAEDLETVYELAAENLGKDPDGYRRDFLELVRETAELMSWNY